MARLRGVEFATVTQASAFDAKPQAAVTAEYAPGPFAKGFANATEIDRFAGTGLRTPGQLRRLHGVPRRDGSFVAFFHRDPEPVWAGIKAAWHALRKDVNYEAWTVTGRIAFAVFCVVVFAMLAPLWLTLAGMFCVAYFGYRVLRAIVRSATDAPSYQRPSAPPTAMQASPGAYDETVKLVEISAERGHEVASANAPAPVANNGTRAPWKRRGHAGWRQAANQELLAMPVRDRASSLIGSMLAAGVVAPVASLLACMLLAPEMPTGLLLWTATTATFASWALMIPGQLAEARMEDHAPLRFTQLLLGALVGLVSWALASSLWLELPASRDFSPGPNESLASEIFGRLYDPVQQGYNGGAVNMPPAMYALYFGCFFVLLRWWRLAESTRASRVRIRRLGHHVHMVVPAADGVVAGRGDGLHRAAFESMDIAKPAPGAGAKGCLKWRRRALYRWLLPG
jgi:hypothetical protein